MGGWPPGEIVMQTSKPVISKKLVVPAGLSILIKMCRSGITRARREVSCVRRFHALFIPKIESCLAVLFPRSKTEKVPSLNPEPAKLLPLENCTFSFTKRKSGFPFYTSGFFTLSCEYLEKSRSADHNNETPW